MLYGSISSESAVHKWWQIHLFINSSLMLYLLYLLSYEIYSSMHHQSQTARTQYFVWFIFSFQHRTKELLATPTCREQTQRHQSHVWNKGLANPSVSVSNQAVLIFFTFQILLIKIWFCFAKIVRNYLFHYIERLGHTVSTTGTSASKNYYTTVTALQFV